MLEGGGRRRSALEGAFEEGKREHRPSGKEPAVAEKDEEHEEGKDSRSHALFDKVTDRTVEARVTAFVVVEKSGREGSEDKEGNQQRNVFSFHF